MNNLNLDFVIFPLAYSSLFEHEFVTPTFTKEILLLSMGLFTFQVRVYLHSK